MIKSHTLAQAGVAGGVSKKNKINETNIKMLQCRRSGGTKTA